MRPLAPRSPWFLYVASLAIGFAVIAASLSLFAQASVRLAQQASPAKSALDRQIESAREIRAALAKPIVIPPLPPITARPLHGVRAVAATPAEPRATLASNAAGMDAMAMGSLDRDVPSYNAAPVRPAVPDRFAPQ